MPPGLIWCEVLGIDFKRHRVQQAKVGTNDPVVSTAAASALTEARPDYST